MSFVCVLYYKAFWEHCVLSGCILVSTKEWLSKSKGTHFNHKLTMTASEFHWQAHLRRTIVHWISLQVFLFNIWFLFCWDNKLLTSSFQNIILVSRMKWLLMMKPTQCAWTKWWKLKAVFQISSIFPHHFSIFVVS